LPTVSDVSVRSNEDEERFLGTIAPMQTAIDLVDLNQATCDSIAVEEFLGLLLERIEISIRLKTFKKEQVMLYAS
jgi:hypothetical protein